MFGRAKWIWSDKDSTPNNRASFFFSVELTELPRSAVIKLGCETKYWLFVNGRLAVYDGGLFRESLPGCGYYDEVDIASFLKPGKNEISVLVRYYGNGGRNNSVCALPGLILECDELSLYSGKDTLCRTENAYYTPKADKPSYLYGGDHTAYDARIARFSLCPTVSGAGKSTVLGGYGDKPWGKLLRRPIPLFRFTERIPCAFEAASDKMTVTLPYAMQLSPYFKVRAHGGEVIDVRTDRYRVHGGPGDTKNVYNGHRAEYVCREGEQEFEMLDWIFGEKLIFTVPSDVEVLELGYRESGYDTDEVATFECNDVNVNRLFEKCVRTLKACMRENYMDCPDRERGQWIGDVSVQAPQIVYLLDGNGLLLLKKAICDFINLRKGDRLVGNVPGDNFSELPSQSLNAISEWGMIATYYDATGDGDILALAFEPVVRYLMLFETDNDGVVLPRKGNWEWYDHLYNCDKPVLNICWYYSALKFASRMAAELGDNRFDAFISERMTAIERVFEERYWNEGMQCYASSCFADDRANAMAVLSGLCPKEKYGQMRYLLTSVFNSTTYMENYVLIALCEMSFKKDAFKRMMSRYQPLIDNENSTLWEDFYHLGTKNHAWSGAPATVLLRYFVGLQADLTVIETDISPLQYIDCSLSNKTIKRARPKN